MANEHDASVRICLYIETHLLLKKTGACNERETQLPNI